MGDWSSDVCSSDLGAFRGRLYPRAAAARRLGRRSRRGPEDGIGRTAILPPRGVRIGHPHLPWPASRADGVDRLLSRVVRPHRPFPANRKGRRKLPRRQRDGARTSASGVGVKTMDQAVHMLMVPAGDMETLRKFYIRSEEHTSELQSLMRTSYAVFCLK